MRRNQKGEIEIGTNLALAAIMVAVCLAAAVGINAAEGGPPRYENTPVRATVIDTQHERRWGDCDNTTVFELEDGSRHEQCGELGKKGETVTLYRWWDNELDQGGVDTQPHGKHVEESHDE